MFDDEKGITQFKEMVNPDKDLGKITETENNRKNFDEAFIAFAYYYIKQLGIQKTDLVINLRNLMLFAKSDDPNPKPNLDTEIKTEPNFNMEGYRTDWLKILNNVTLKEQKYEKDVLDFVKKYFEEKERDDVKQNMYYINKTFFQSYYNKYNDKYDDNTLTRNVLKGCVPFYKDGKYIPTINSDVKISSGLGLESARMKVGLGLPKYDPDKTAEFIKYVSDYTSTNQGENKNTVTDNESNKKNGGRTRRRQKRKSKRKSTKRRTKRKLRRKNTKK